MRCSRWFGLNVLLTCLACGNDSMSGAGDGGVPPPRHDGGTPGDAGRTDASVPSQGEPDASDDELARRPLEITGRAISYSPFRDGQGPGWEWQPSDEQILEDLQIIARHWQALRTYGSGGPTEAIVRLIAEHDLPIKVMLGAWLNPEPDQGAMQGNEAETDRAIALAEQYPEVVAAVSVANEVLVDWSTHKVPLKRVIHFVRKVRNAVAQPVTTADNYVWWRESGAELAREVDFIVIHTYPLWERYNIDLSNPNDRAAIEYTIENYEGVRAAHPNVPIVIGEAGWASENNWNPQIVPGAGDEAKQVVYYEQLMEWTEREKIVTFVFEMFDEKWKGGPDPLETEKHWGLFYSDRTPKPVMQELFADLVPSDDMDASMPDDMDAGEADRDAGAP